MYFVFHWLRQCECGFEPDIENEFPCGQKTETKRKFGGDLVLDDLDWRNVGRDLLFLNRCKAVVGPRKRCKRRRRVPRAAICARSEVICYAASR